MSLTEYTTGDKAIWNQGRIYEQQRIIKLLQSRTLNRNEKGVTIDLQYVKDGMYAFVNLTPQVTEELIDLIKGEN